MRSGIAILLICLALLACSSDERANSPAITQLDNPAGSGARYPFTFRPANADSVLMSWLEDVGDEVELRWASFNGESWSATETIHSSQQFFVNWADFPSIVANGESPTAAHWLQKVADSTYAYHVNLAVRSDSGEWSEPITPHADRSAGEHGFVAMLPLDEERVFLIWLDGYQTGKGQPMTLRSVIVNRDGSIGEEQEIDGSVCDCCQTSVARTGDSIVAVYRNRTEDEIRDIYTAIFDLNTGRWSEPQTLSEEGWEIHGCPVNGPQVAANGNTVLASWFSAVNNQPRSYVAVSRDGGKHFSAPEQIDVGKSAGRVGLSFNDNDEALLSWVEFGGETNMIYGRLWRNQVLEEPFVIGRIHGSRQSGFPRAAGMDSDFIVAWTEVENDQGRESGITTVLVSSPVN